MKILILLCTLISLSAWSSELSYLSPTALDLADFPPPPALNSAADKKDLAWVLEWQGLRTESDCKRAQIEDEGLASSFFAPPYGPLTLEGAKKLEAFQERLFNEVNYFSRILKQKWKRQRPFTRDARIHPCVPFIASASYPSGHAAIGYVAGEVFSILYPEFRAEFEKRGYIIGEDRVIGGVHHPLDIVAGRELGRRLVEALLKSEAFQKDLLQHVP